jgi:hypothetical protein
MAEPGCRHVDRSIHEREMSNRVRRDEIRRLDPVREFFSFPNPVNNTAARLVATGVIMMAVTAIVARQPWISAVIAYGFLARVLAGPRLSPLARVAVLLAPRMGGHPRYVPGPPKRFAQSLGAAMSLLAMALWLSGHAFGAYVTLAVLLLPAALEAVFGYCVGCEIFAIGMRLGIVPDSICLECADIYRTRARHHRFSN